MNLRDLLQQLTWRSGIDIVLVGALFYQIIAMLKGTRAAQVLIGMLVIFLTYVLSSLLELETLNWIISKFYSSFIFVVIVLFQDDIRRLLTRFGRGPFVSGLDQNSGLRVIEEVVNAAKNLSHDRIGAIVVFERGIGLDRLYDHSVRVDGLVSEQLLVCIFQSFSPLHDGAVIVQKNRMSCASAQLPLSKNPLFSKKLGTRHSAAVGMSEETDAIVLVVSEETGNISIASDGQIQRQHSLEAARRQLVHLLMPKGDKSALKSWFEKSFLAFFSFSIPKSKRTKSKNQPVATAKELDGRGVAEYENRLASGGNALHLRFPRYSKIKSARADAAKLVLSNKIFSHDKLEMPFASESSILAGARDNPARNSQYPLPQSPLLEASGDEHMEVLKDAENGAENPMLNEAAVSLSHLGPQDKFIPPISPLAPPRDVSIGGVSLNPPIDKIASDAEITQRLDEPEGIPK